MSDDNRETRLTAQGSFVSAAALSSVGAGAAPALKGIYPPVPTFFDAHEELDLATLQRHIRNLAGTGIAGYVVMGTNGEAPHLTGDERVQVIEAVRGAAGPSVQIIAGCGEQSTRATIANCLRAAHAAASAVLILPPSYYKNLMHQRALLAHYRAIADSSPLPLVIYNMPASAAGLDLDAATICALADHPNIIAVKDSAGDVAKLARIIGQAPADFRVFAGSAGYLLPALSVGAVGAVAALANIFPRQVCRVQELFSAGRLQEARTLQAALVAPNTAVTATFGVPGLKAALALTGRGDIVSPYSGRDEDTGRPPGDVVRGTVWPLPSTGGAPGTLPGGQVIPPGTAPALPSTSGPYLRSPLQPLTEQERTNLREILESVPR